MRRSSPLRSVGLFVAGASLALGVGLGLWPVSVTVVGAVPYSCGSGFVHSRNTWKVDTQAMGEPQQLPGAANATPNSVCPSRVYRHRDFGYALIALAALTYAALVATAAFDPAATPISSRRRRATILPRH